MSKNTDISELINYISVNGSGHVVFTTVPSAASNTDKFLVSDSGVLKFRTAAQLLSDIGAQASGNYQTALTNPVTGTGTANYLPKFIGSTSIANSLIFDNGTNVLIGTTTAPTPVAGVSFPLSVTSSAVTRIRIDSTQATPNSGFGLYASSVQKWSIAMFGTGSDFTIYNDALLASAILVKGASSNVLVGYGTSTADTGYKLDVNGTARFNNTLNGTIANFVNAFTDTINITSTAAGTTKGHIGQFADSLYISNNYFYNGAQSFDDTSKANSSIEFAAGSLLLKTGAANTVPGTKLSISSTGAATFSSSVTAGSWFSAPNNFGLEVRNAANTNGRTVIKLNTSNQIEIGRDSDISQIIMGTASATEALTITSSGYLWVNGAISGFTGSTVTLMVNGASRLGGNTIIHQAGTANQIVLSCPSNGTLNIGGQLGVNNSTPSGIFHATSNGITASSPSLGWPVYNAELDANARLIYIDTTGNGSISTAGSGATVVLQLGQYYDSRVVITPIGSGGAGPSDQGTGRGKDLMLKAGTSDNGAGMKGGRLYLNGGMGYQSAFNANGGDILMQVLTGSGNVGIGTSSPTEGLVVSRGALRITSQALDFTTGTRGISIDTTDGNVGRIYTVTGTGTATDLTFGTNNSERIRITTWGQLLIGKSSTSVETLGLRFDADASIYASITNIESTYYVRDINNAAYRFRVSGAGTVFATNTTISSISDIRLKENVRDLDNGLDKIMLLKPRVFDWKEGSGQTGKDVRGFIAQEVEEFFPEMIDEWGNENLEEGEIPYKSVRMDVIPMLVKAIQELKAENNLLKDRLDKNNIN